MTPTTLRLYRKLRMQGWHASMALHCAKAQEAFDDLGEECVRIRVEPDECADMDSLKGDCFNPRVNPDVPRGRLEREEKAFEEKVEREGVWGFIAEYFDPRTETWEHADSCWGFVGDRDAWDAGYAYDGMRAAVDAYQKAKHESSRYGRDGRTLTRDGVPILSMQRVEQKAGPDNDYSTGNYALAPWEADEMAQRIVDLLNKHGVVLKLDHGTPIKTEVQ